MTFSKKRDTIIDTLTERKDLMAAIDLVWHKGIKHDCSKVTELENITENTYSNKYNDVFHLEDDLIFPLAKLKDFREPIVTDFKRYVIVTQKKSFEEQYISNLTQTWYYLNKHANEFSNRKDVIYIDAPRFSMLGIDDYTYKRYKVAIPSFYKNPVFSLMYSDKPVVVKSNVCFLAFDNYNIAYSFMLLLNSSKVHDLLMSIANLDSKKPFNAKTLSKLDLKKCIDNVSFEDMQETEKLLHLESAFDKNQYDSLREYIYSL